MTAMADLCERRSLFDDDHEAFRASVREFLARRVAGHVDAWEKQGDIPREVWLAAGARAALEYPIARAYADTRITTVFGGTTEIMKVIIARSVLGVR
jgi:alkylation response protein AidB-like acyl-CoA dehydrogenase